MALRWSLLVSALLASQAVAQQPASETGAPSSHAVTEIVTDPQVPFNSGGAPAGMLSGNHNFPNFINWISNPLSNIDPRAVTAMYPMFGGVWFDNTPPVPDGDMQIYGPALTIALSDRFAMGMNQGGLADTHFSRNPALRDRLIALDPTGRFRDVENSHQRDGWLDLGGFFQYTVIQDCQDQCLLTAGLRWIAPAGSPEVFQGHGPLELAPYLTAGKEFGKYHVLATVGYQFPAGPGSDYTENFYANLHLDRQCFGWLYPLIEFNSNFVTKSISFGLPSRHGFIDLGNFEAEGDVVSMAIGANAVLKPERLEIGAVYITVISSQHNFDADGLLVKMTLRF
jgi:hypothetical protein